MDVEALYSNVPFEGGLQAAEYYLNQRAHQVPNTACLIDLMKLVLTHNYFLFGSDFFLQISGVSMGSKMAPSFASLFCGLFEEQFVFNQASNPFIKYIVAWKRYIDDIFFIWSGTESQLVEFHELVNASSDALTFTMDAQVDQFFF